MKICHYGKRYFSKCNYKRTTKYNFISIKIVFFNNSFAFFVGHRKRLESSKQILKTAKYIREIKTPEVCLKEIKQDYPLFGLTYLYEYQYTNSSLGK